MIPNILSIAGSDPSGGAGVQADLKTFSALSCYGMAAITALTAQNTQGVRSVVSVPERFMRDQLAAIFDDIDVHAVKIGMLSSSDIINAVADMLEMYKAKNIVLDPVMVATSGDPLIDQDAVHALKERLIPMAHVMTPNIPEAEKLSRKAVIDMENAAQGLLSLGSSCVYLKGGHLKGESALDVLATSDGAYPLSAPRIVTQNTHGTGCTLSSALAAYLGRGYNVKESAESAKNYITMALKYADELSVGKGRGPVNHGYQREVYVS